MHSSPSISLSRLGFSWPDGTVALADLTATFGGGRTSIVGLNGTGKSTLLRLIAGELSPTTGTVSTTGDVGYLRQDLALDTAGTLADLLGIRSRLRALAAIENGSTDQRDYDIVGSDWDVAERAAATLASLGLAGLGLDRTAASLSGGEIVLAGIAGLRLGDAPITLLDEPTNNLDRRARHALYATVEDWRGALVVVSHDRELLDCVDVTAELRHGSLRSFGGTYSAFAEALATEQNAAERSLRVADQAVRAQKRQRIDAESKLSKRASYAQTTNEKSNAPKILTGALKRSAQVSAGKLRGVHDDRLTGAQLTKAEAESRVRDDRGIRIDLPGTVVPADRRMLQVLEPDLLVHGRERIAITGANGVGKTTLLNAIEACTPPVLFRVPQVGYLRQRLDVLDDSATVLENVLAVTDAAPGEVRAQLARFLFRGRAVDKLAGALSGGERFRVSLARILLADPAPQLLLLDEPTNSLDLPSVDHLIEALGGYRGALVVVNHDESFLARLGISRTVELKAAVGG